jgi:transposase InsO family protein
VSRYRCIEAEKAHFPIALLCRVLGVSRSGYDAWGRRAASARARADAVLTAQVRAIDAASRGVSGVPRVHAALRAEGTRVGRKRVARLLGGAQRAGVRRGAQRPRTTVADPTRPAAPHRIDRDFRAAAPNRRGVGDLTYVPTGEGWL